MSGDRFLEDLDAMMLAGQPTEHRTGSEQTLSFSKVTLIDGHWRLSVSPFLIAKDFWIGFAQERAFLILFGSQVSIQVPARERSSAPRKIKHEFADCVHELEGLKFRLFSFDGDFEGDVLRFDRRSRQVHIEDSDVGGHARIPLAKVRCVEIIFAV